MADKSIKKLADTIIKVVDQRLNQKPKSYDTQAVVRRIDTQTGEAFVHIPNGIDETPVRLTIDAAVGDTVQVRVADGKAWLTGNRTAPPTDDTTARVAQGTAAKAEVKAEQAEETANAVSGIANSALSQAAAAKQIADDTEQHFWFTETGADTGAHITEVTQDEWEDISDPNYHAGGNLLARTNGIAVRDGMTELASFGASGAVIGQNASGKSRTEVSTSGMQIIQNVSGVDTQIAHLGYGIGYDYSGDPVTAPFYAIGTRKSGSIVGNYSLVEGINNTASGYCSQATGQDTYALGPFSHSEGEGTQAQYDWSHAEGQTTTAGGSGSHSEGKNTAATGAFSHAEGDETKAQSESSHAEGDSTTASGFAAHAEGSLTKATTFNTHAEGVFTTASGNSSHAEGVHATASGDYSHVQNYYTVADQSYQTAIGKYNTTGNTNNLFVVGNGTADNARSDAFTVDKSGNVVAAGDLTAANIGVFLYHLPSSVSCNTGRYYQVAYLALAPGLWLIDCNAYFPSTNTTGTRQILVTTDTSGYNNVTTAPSVYGNITRDVLAGINAGQYPQAHFPVSISANTTFRLIAYQGSGSTISVAGRMYAVRVK